MSIPAVLLPVFVLILLTFVLNVWMGGLRVTSIRSGDVKVRDIALGERNWTPRTQQIANAFHNQFELPILFYVLVALALITRKADLLFVVMAWVFVALRLIHAYVFVTTNNVPGRGLVHFGAVIVLFFMWTVFALRILLEA